MFNVRLFHCKYCIGQTCVCEELCKSRAIFSQLTQWGGKTILSYVMGPLCWAPNYTQNTLEERDYKGKVIYLDLATSIYLLTCSCFCSCFVFYLHNFMFSFCFKCCSIKPMAIHPRCWFFFFLASNQHRNTSICCILPYGYRLELQYAPKCF